MRVLQLNDLYDPRIGSSVRQMYQHARRLRELGHEAEILSVTQDAALVGEDGVGQAEVEGCVVHLVHSEYDPRWRGWVGLDNERVRDSVRRVYARFQPDVVHTHLIHTHLSYRALQSAHESGAGVVFTAHDVMTFCYQKLTCFHGGPERGGLERDYEARLSKCVPCQRLRFRPGRNRAIRQALARYVDRFTVVSDELGRAIAANGIRVDRTVWNAIEPHERLPTGEEVAGFKRARGVEGQRLIAIGGRLHEQKGVGQLLRMLALLREEFPDLRLLVMGKRDVYDREFAPLARELGVHEAVVPTGWLDGDELLQAYAAVDVFVTPSICFDTFGLVNLEAMEHSKPVVATEFGGSPEVVLDGSTGRIGNPFAVQEFANRISELLRDPEQAASLGANGRQRMVELFTIPRLTDEFVEEYVRAVEAARLRTGA
ncbi:MAG: glycosyltransferase family 4 protein [Planctomycetota bacterium]